MERRKVRSIRYVRDKQLANINELSIACRVTNSQTDMFLLHTRTSPAREWSHMQQRPTQQQQHGRTRRQLCQQGRPLRRHTRTGHCCAGEACRATGWNRSATCPCLGVCPPSIVRPRRARRRSPHFHKGRAVGRAALLQRRSHFHKGRAGGRAALLQRREGSVRLHLRSGWVLLVGHRQEEHICAHEVGARSARDRRRPCEIAARSW